MHFAYYFWLFVGVFCVYKIKLVVRIPKIICILYINTQNAYILNGRCPAPSASHTICMAPTKKNNAFCTELTILERMPRHYQLATAVFLSSANFFDKLAPTLK